MKFDIRKTMDEVNKIVGNDVEILFRSIDDKFLIRISKFYKNQWHHSEQAVSLAEIDLDRLNIIFKELAYGIKDLIDCQKG